MKLVSRKLCGEVFLLTVDAVALHAAGHDRANGAWLTDHVPPGSVSGLVR